MTRDGECELLDFRVVQRVAFDAEAWARFDAVSRMELATTARYLAGVDWYGHRAALAQFADSITPLSFGQLAQTEDFDPSRFRARLEFRLARAENRET